LTELHVRPGSAFFRRVFDRPGKNGYSGLVWGLLSLCFFWL